MAGRFFMRFNLHSSVGHFPVTADIFEHLLPYDRKTLQEELDDFERIQSDRTGNLKQKYPCEIEKIRNKRVLFIGDSITSDNLGYRVSVTRTAELEAYDASISGGTSPMMIQDAWVLSKKYNPDIVSIMIGCNDSVLLDGMPLVSPGEYERNVRSMVKWAKESGAKVMLFEVTPIDEKAFEKNFSEQRKTQTNKNIDRYNTILQEIARNNDIELISNAWIKGNADLLEPDGLHLSAKGQTIFAEKWISAAAKII
jgi:lysophospholipase L1-like esterase